MLDICIQDNFFNLFQILKWLLKIKKNIYIKNKLNENRKWD